MRRAAAELRQEGVEAVAVCFLFSYLNPAHEDRARAILARGAARRLRHHLVVGRAAVPRVRALHHRAPVGLHRAQRSRYVGASRKRRCAQAGIDGELRIMASNGGVATPAMVAEKPALTLLSGLAAGVLGGGWVGALARARRG